VIYERIEDGRIYDDLPGLVESQVAGKVEAVFAPNLGSPTTRASTRSCRR
jgi:hypothetical protein